MPSSMLRAACLILYCTFPLTGLAEDEAVRRLQAQLDQQQAQIEALAAQLERSRPATGHLERFRFGGYGEMHYNQLAADDPARDAEQVDFHRFILYAGYHFSDRIRFFSELELEHALVKDTDDGSNGGEVELEQAFLEFDMNEGALARAGIVLIPVGILNETHEPPTFFGVERNDVENIIIPTTWWAGGAQFTQRFAGGLSVDVGVHEGLAVPTTGGSAFRIRNGRQKSSNAAAGDLAASGRLKFSGVPGLEIALSAVRSHDASQADGDGLNGATLGSGHVVLDRGVFALRALYAQWDLEGAGPRAAGVARQSGWYVEPAVKPLDALGLYLRYEDLDGARTQDRFTEWEAGANWWPHPDVVIKFDLRRREHELAGEAGRDFDGFDLGIGYRY